LDAGRGWLIKLLLSEGNNIVTVVDVNGIAWKLNIKRMFGLINFNKEDIFYFITECKINHQ
jgi:hypothetical protein